MKEEIKGFILWPVCITVFFLVSITACKREQMPLAEVETTGILTITPVSALVSGKVVSVMGDELIEKGICWGKFPSPTINDNKDSTFLNPYLTPFEIIINHLTPETRYYVRAYASSAAGTAYGEELSFVTPFDLSGEQGSVTDIDGNVYSTIGIGTQVWMAENLKTTSFNDGASIPEVSANDAWCTTWTPACCWYDNDEESGRNTYGALYNWYAVSTGKLCPAGWHVPDSTEIQKLTICLGGQDVAGGKMKVPGTQFWDPPNTGATNSSGFSGLPAGLRWGDNGGFFRKGRLLYLWTPSMGDSKNRTPWAWSYIISYDYSSLGLVPATSLSHGYSVRCIKD
jgi:uncharacterized protein (TIGR02145 family)